MKHKWLTCVLTVCMLLCILPFAAQAANEPAVAQVGTKTYDSVQDAIEAAEAPGGNGIVTILAGEHTAAEGQPVTVNKSVTFVGEGNRDSKLVNYVFNVRSDTEGEVSVTFDNLSFTGKSQIKVGGSSGLVDLTVNNCYAYLTHDSVDENGQKGQLIFPVGGYSSELELTVTNCELINDHSINGEDAAPVIHSEGNLLKSATITGNIFGSAQYPCDRVAIKFARRMDDTTITISDNTIYGATTESKDFYILNFWQSGSDAHDGLAITLAHNTVNCDIVGGHKAYAALIQNTVTTSDEKTEANLIVADGNTVNGVLCDDVVNEANATKFPMAEAKVVKSDRTTTYYAAANDAIKAAPEGSTVTLLQNVGGISIQGKKNIAVDGNGNNVGSVVFEGANDRVTLKNAEFIMTGDNTINLISPSDQSNDNITISDCTFTLNDAPNPWVAIYVQNLSSGLTIENNEFNIHRTTDKTFQCIGFAYTPNMRANDATITGNTMTADHTNGYSYFVIGSRDAVSSTGEKEYGITDLKIYNNDITYSETSLGDQYCTSFANIDGLEVKGNSFNNCSVGVYLSSKEGLPTKNVSITGNSGNETYSVLIYGNNALSGSFETDVPADKINIYGNDTASAIIKVDFNANGGNCDVKSKVLALTDGSAVIGKLPIPTHNGSYDFVGWFDENGNRVTADTVLTKNTSLTARWNYTGSVGFNISVAGTEHGTVTVNPTIAAAGDTVTIQPVADPGYQVQSVTVTDTDGNKIDVTAAANGTYSFVMPRKSVKVAVTFAAGAAAMAFTDIDSNAYYYDAVCWAVMHDITNGVTATTFGPDFSCTRAQMVTFLWRAAGAPKPANTENPFTDVKSGDYYYDAVLWAVEKGITKGVTATTFCPSDTVSRAQTVTFLWRYDGAKTTAGNSFTDVDADAYYTDAVEWAVDHGVTTGATGTTFAPNADCTRAQIVTFLYRYMG